MRKFIGITIIWMGFAFLAFSQSAVPTNPYFINFETGWTHPAVKAYASVDTVWLDSIPWTMPGVALGTMSANDFHHDAHAARFRLTENTTGDGAYMEMLEDFPFGIQTVSFYTAMFGNETGGQLGVYFSVDGGQNWVMAEDTVPVNVPHDNPMIVNLTIGVEEPVRLKIAKLNPQNVRINVDDIAISWFGTGVRSLITHVNPTGVDIPLNQDTLSIRFDQPIVPNSGVLKLIRHEGDTQLIAIPSANVMTVDSTAYFTGFTLLGNAQYSILLTDSAFTGPIDSLYTMPISDIDYWTFKTVDTTPEPIIPPLKELNESFVACNTAQDLIGLFSPYNIKGSQTWECSGDGHDDFFAVSISGGFSAHSSQENEDWLISVLPFDFSEMEHPMLSFWQKAIFEGQAERTVKISHNYPGFGDPLADSVIWETLHIPGFADRPSSDWELIEGIDLESYKAHPFYLAFTYSCGTTGTYRLLYDNIRVWYPTAIKEPSKNPNPSLKVLGWPRNSSFDLEINTPQWPTKGTLILFDAMGRTLEKKEIILDKPKMRFNYVSRNLTQGAYFLKYISREGGVAVVQLLIP